MSDITSSYLAALKERAKTSRVYRSYQLDGLEIARLLGDERHRSLYIKLAKEHGGARLRALAGAVSADKRVKNKGAYFMWQLHRLPLEDPTRRVNGKSIRRTRRRGTKGRVV